MLNTSTGDSIKPFLTMVVVLLALLMYSPISHAHSEPANATTSPATQPANDEVDIDEMLAAMERELLNVEEGEPVFTLSQAIAWRDEVMPLVEEITGHAFASPPPIKLVKHVEMTKVMESEARIQIRTLFPDMPDLQQEVLIAQATSFKGATHFGKYSVESGSVLLPAGIIPSLMKQYEIPSELLPAVMKLVIAHEIAHAAYDKELDIESRWQAMANEEQSVCENSLSEGFAVFVHRKVAAQLQVVDAMQRMETAMGMDRVPQTTQAGQSLRGVIIYGMGAAFIEHHYDKGGMDRVWDILRDPPVQFNYIAAPQLVRTDAERREQSHGLDLESMLRSIELPIDDTWRTTHMGGEGRFAANVFQGLPPDDVDRYIELIEFMHTMIVAQSAEAMTQMQSMIGISVYGLNRARDGETLVDGIETAVKMKFAIPEGVDVRPSPVLTPDDVDYIEIHDHSSIMAIAGESGRLIMVVGWTDDIVVQLIGMNVEFEGGLAAHIFRDVQTAYRDAILELSAGQSNTGDKE